METMDVHPDHRILYIKVKPQTVVDRGSLYEAVRWAWRVDVARAEAADWVVAVINGTCRGVYAVHRWEPSGERGRSSFVGTVLDGNSEVARRYVGRLIPDEYRGREGGRNPVRYGW